MKLNHIGLILALLLFMTACLSTPTLASSTIITLQSLPTKVTTIVSAPSKTPAFLSANTVTSEPSLAPSAIPTIALPTIPPPTPCAPPLGWPAYIIRGGDTLSQIAFNTGTSVEQLMAANCLTGDMIYIGQPLFVPFIPVIVPTPELLPAFPPPAPMPISTAELLPAPGPGNLHLNIEPFSGPAGTVFTITMDKFKPNENVTVTIAASDTLEQRIYWFTITVDASGHGAGQYYSQLDTASGWYTAEANGDQGTYAEGQLIINP